MKQLFVVFFTTLICVNLQAQNPSLFTKTDRKGTAVIKSDEVYVKGMNVTANIKQLSSSQNERFSVILPNGEMINIIKRREENPDKRHKIWYGEVVNAEESFIMLSIMPTAITGHINLKDKSYRITYLGNNVHQIAETDPTKFKENINDKIKPEIQENNIPFPDCPDSPTNIDVMVVYTPAATAGAGGLEGMETYIYECVYRTNLAYENSNVNLRLRLVHQEQVTYTETGNSNTDLTRLQGNGDLFMDNVHTLRNLHGADVVVLLTETLDFCGLGYFMEPISSSFNNWSFAVVKRDCASGNLSFAHEIGHNMGADHDCGSTNPLNSAGIQHGHFVSNPTNGGTSWRTVMAYNVCSTGPCTRIPYFSNPAISVGSDATGTNTGTCQNNNATRLNNAASTVANFKCSSPNVNNVWMKDSWNDTGIEPNTTGGDMWRSPYIWVRNTQDPTLLHQHEHQNPEFGQTNWVYIKIQNGSSSTQNGNLELYVANASTSLVWQNSWTQIGTIPATLNGNATTILPFQWNNVPNPSAGGSHYCMIARWVSATDPMHTPENSDINFNVSQNNNIIWRNMNIVNLSGDELMKIVFAVDNPAKNASKLVFSDITKFPKKSFIENGEIIVQFDEKLFNMWRKGGGKTSGSELLNDKTFKLKDKISSFDNLLIPSGYKGNVTLIFKKNKNTPKNNFEFSVRQYIKNGSLSKRQVRDKLLGGIDYEIQNFNK